MPKAAKSSPKKETKKKEAPKKDSPKKEAKKKREEKPPAKNLREYSIATGLDKRLVPATKKREHKPVERFTEVVSEPKEEKEIVVPKGKGKKLSDIPHIESQIKKRAKSDDLLKTLHGTIIGRVSKSVDVKENLLKFSGVVYEDDEKGRIHLENKLNTLVLRVLRQFNAFFGLDPEGEREDVVERLAKFLEKPKDTGETFEIPGDKKKRKRSSSSGKSSKSPSKKKKKDPNEPKRPLSAYIFFSNDLREELQKKYPKEAMTDISKRLGAKWKKISAEDKKKYEKEAEKDKARYEKEMKKYNSGK